MSGRAGLSVRVRPKRLAACCVLVAALTACGTTVPAAERIAAGQGDRRLGGTTAGGTVVPGGLAGGTGAVPGLDSTTGGAVGTTGAGPGAVPAPGSSGMPGGRPGAVIKGAETGRGFTKGVIKIGVSTAEDASTFASSLGIEGLSTGDTKGQIDAVVNDINKRGGVVGRRVVAVVHDFNTAELLGNPAQAMQAACARWTQDEPVFAVVNPPLVESTLLDCLKKARTPLIYSGMDYPRSYRALYAEYPDFFNINAMLGETYDELAIKRLVARRFFTQWDTLNGRPGSSPLRIGLIRTTGASGDALQQSYTRQLARHGLRFHATISCPIELSAGLSCRQGAGLRFQSDNITHVFGTSVPFMQQSEQQRYRPRYFLDYQPNSYAANAPAAQLAGAMGESYMPALDVAASEDPGPPTTATTRCKSVMARGGQQSNERSVGWYMQIVCDGMYFVEAALKIEGRLGEGVLRSGLERLGTTQPAAMTWLTRLSSNEHAGVRAFRDIEYRSSCGCFVYPDRINRTL